MVSEYKEYYVSLDNGKTFHVELLKAGEIKKKRDMGQIVNKYPCHKCYYYFTKANNSEGCNYGGKHIEDGECVAFTDAQAYLKEAGQEIYGVVQGGYDIDDDWN